MKSRDVHESKEEHIALSHMRMTLTVWAMMTMLQWEVTRVKVKDASHGEALIYVGGPDHLLLQ